MCMLSVVIAIVVVDVSVILPTVREFHCVCTLDSVTMCMPSVIIVVVDVSVILPTVRVYHAHALI